ncbi:MAG: type secretion protein [Naasia sp.]|jgi:early secretory antigenic target protein ESAT-6|uniref:WXG100 family type VII secretion target n=1 Tax=Naasia sp. TaxID=2546198 RepID=UPI00263306CF|nr:WXG100 family type VII secretion target [Naasia sp.]MCU1569531.1 type secretion protein [Naasia sp.]
MTRFSVDGEAVLAASSAVASTIPRVQSDVAALLAQLTSLQESWGGSAALAFQSVVNDWRTTQQRVDEALVAINQALAAAGRQYLDVEEANARMFRAG